MNPRVYIIAGPTGVGKTAVAIELAKRLKTAIISADSRQCYAGMTIGTAKPSPAELAVVRHYFVDEFSVTQAITAADFEKLALSYLDEILAANNTAIVCGGTGLYIKALCEGLDEMPGQDAEIAADIDRKYKANGLKWLQDAVREEDPVFYTVSDTNNPARLRRALAFVRSTGQSITAFQTNSRKRRHFDVVKVGLDLQREVLYNRINERVDKMMELGLVSEVKSLSEFRHLKNLQTVGYSEIFDYLDGKMTLPEAIDKIKQHTRNYAKRQWTWFRKDKELTWLRADDGNLVEQILGLTPVN